MKESGVPLMKGMMRLDLIQEEIITFTFPPYNIYSRKLSYFHLWSTFLAMFSVSHILSIPLKIRQLQEGDSG